jgi:DNA-directed RNA polymerase specialized sigma subunit
MKAIRAFKIYNLPTLIEQQKVINGIDGIAIKTKKSEAIYQQKIDDLEELKKSVLNKAFKGELVTEKELAYELAISERPCHPFRSNDATLKDHVIIQKFS